MVAATYRCQGCKSIFQLIEISTAKRKAIYCPYVRFRANKNDPWIENLHLFDDAFIGKTKVISKKNRTMNVS
jgi:DNA-directed RNA polymerase subunit RPC12/RpoP